MDYPTDPTINLHPTTGKFTDGDAGAGIPASRDSGEEYNQIWDELLHLITTAGMIPDEGDLTQCVAAVKNLMAAHGLGVASSNGLPENDGTWDMDALVVTGFYFAQSNSTGKPPGAGGGHVIVNNNRAGTGDSYLAQIWQNSGNSKVWMRARVNLVWQPWRVVVGYSELDEYPHISEPGNVLSITAGAAEVVIDAGQEFFMRLTDHVSTDDYSAAERTLGHSASKTYHLRWTRTAGFELRDLADAGYNPGALTEDDPGLDSGYDDMLIARVVTDAGNTATVTPLANARHLRADVYLSMTLDADTLVWTALSGSSITLNWGRAPTHEITAMNGFANTNGFLGQNIPGNSDILQDVGIRPAAGASRYAAAAEYVYADASGSHGTIGYTHRLEAL